MVNHKLETILAMVDCTVDTSACKSEFEKLKKCLDLVEKMMSVKKDVKELVNKLEDLKMIEGEEKKVPKTDIVDEDAAIKASRSIKEITEQVTVFVNRFDEAKVSCEV